MAFARPKADANGEFMHQRFTELSDVIRAKNKREDRLLNVRIKFYERQKKINLSLIHKEQHQVERTRASICEEAIKIQAERQNPLAVPSWMSPRPTTVATILQFSEMEFTGSDCDQDSSVMQSDIVPSTTTDTTIAAVADIIRPHSAR